MTSRIVAVYCLQHHHNHGQNTVLRPGSSREKKLWPSQNSLKYRCKRSHKSTKKESWKQLISALILPLLYSQESKRAPHLWFSAGHRWKEKEIFLGLIQRQYARVEDVQSVCDSPPSTELTSRIQALLPAEEKDRRIIESLRLEKTSKIIKFNCQQNTTMPAKPCATSTRFLNTSRDGESTTSLGSLF